MLKESMVYQANITTNISGYKEKTYLGPSETIFKIHYGSHEKSFTKQPLDTELSKERLMVKKQRNTHNEAESVKEISLLQSFILCLNEKYEIATNKRDDLLSKRTEIFGTCRHRNRYKLRSYDLKD